MDKKDEQNMIIIFNKNKKCIKQVNFLNAESAYKFYFNFTKSMKKGDNNVIIRYRFGRVMALKSSED